MALELPESQCSPPICHAQPYGCDQADCSALSRCGRSESKKVQGKVKERAGSEGE
eukprot:CAMPEP_0202875970 /NCGR_PEP_ID=MMETSP1391-20130828/28264_1 /ASSEMBLY_ACC=CAM_ASM_000867 /TAXON_ID=1034604 /ORGANISM="Chlamydomonas leiostraca, Strain SAG 11-49" /LENGTH=54 /DNA_ID=CAMNT_0049557743 /DNA_START=951 /DNA_END=1115 /DNA_ORIENTATION=+